MSACYLGIELGGTKQQIAVGDELGGILSLRCEKLELKDGAQTIRGWLEESIPAILDECGNGIRHICVGFGGPVESATGKILTSVQVEGWKDFPLKDWFEKRFGIMTTVLNDTVAGGFGELACGSGKDADVFFYSNIGTGIGGALFIGRHYYDGTGCGAAYLGNTYVPDLFGGREEKIVKLEDYCSGVAIERRLRRPGYVGGGSVLLELCGGDTALLSCEMLAAAAEKEDAFALEEIDRVAKVYAVGLGNFLTLVSPDVVAIGGGVGNMGEFLLEPVRRYCREVEFISVRDRYKIVRSELKDNIVLVGALRYAASNTGDKLTKSLAIER